MLHRDFVPTFLLNKVQHLFIAPNNDLTCSHYLFQYDKTVNRLERYIREATTYKCLHGQFQLELPPPSFSVFLFLKPFECFLKWQRHNVPEFVEKTRICTRPWRRWSFEIIRGPLRFHLQLQDLSSNKVEDKLLRDQQQDQWGAM